MARPDLVEPDALNRVVDVCLREGNHDRQFWITDPLMSGWLATSGVTCGCHGKGRCAYMSAAAVGRWTPKCRDVRDAI